MPLLNYTTSIDSLKTISEIQRCLVEHGARQISLGYGPGKQPDAIEFLMPTVFGDRPFRLPCRLAAVEQTLRDQCRAGKIARRFTTPEQAARVGWRIVKDWIEAQMAIIESGMVSLDEVFLPYMIGSHDRTVYQVMREQHLALSPPNEDQP